MSGNVNPLVAANTGTSASTGTSSSGGTLSASSGSTKPTKSQANDFMQLLVAQMTHQSPLNPTSGDQFMMQLAQLQMVSEMHELSSKMQDWASTQALSGASSLIGHNVKIVNGSQTFSGLVDSVTSQQGKLQVIVGGQPYDMSLVTEVK